MHQLPYCFQLVRKVDFSVISQGTRAVTQHKRTASKGIKSLMKRSALFVLLAGQIFSRFSGLGPVLVKHGHHALQVGGENPGASGILHVSYKAHMEKAGDGFLQGLNA